MKVSKFISNLVIWSLKTTKIQGEDKTKLINALLENMDALPIKDAVSIENGQVLLRGKPIDSIETAQSLKQGASAMRQNFTRKIVQEQILFECSKIGLHLGKTPEDIMFAKAAIWVLMTEDNMYKSLDEL